VTTAAPRSPATENLAEEIRQARQDAGLTQEELAERAECSVNSIRAWEQGVRMPRRSHALRIVRGVLADLKDEGRPQEGAPVKEPVEQDRHDEP
jgi:DNA-binding transcriptional regulator YiaG